MFVYVYVCRGDTSACTHRRQRLELGIFLYSFPWYYLKTGFLTQLDFHSFGWTGLPVGLCARSILPSLSVLSLPAYVTGHDLLCGSWGFKPRFSCLCGKHFTCWAMSSAPKSLEFIILQLNYLSLFNQNWKTECPYFKSPMSWILSWLWFLQRTARLQGQDFSQLSLLQCDIDLVLNGFFFPFCKFPTEWGVMAAS